MSKRFFKLVYFLSLIALGLSLPVYLITSIQFDAVVRTSYKAKCLSNNQYVVLEGSLPNQVYVFEEFVLKDSPFTKSSETIKNLNFYCKYYNEARSFVIAYNDSKNSSEQINVNKKFFSFQESMLPNVSLYPLLYELEVVNEEFQSYEIFNPIISWFSWFIFAFLLLQIVKLCYVYVAFGEIVWHPFKQSNK